MSTKIARNDAQIVRQVTTLTPTPANASTYKVKLNSKLTEAYTSDASATAQEIVEGVAAKIALLTSVPEFTEVTWTENDLVITGTGPTTGEPFTALDGGGTGTFTPATTTTAKSPNHWIAENFDSGTLPATGDDVILTQLSTGQSFYWNLDHNAVELASLEVKLDSEAEIGLPEYHASGYYQKGYRETHLKLDTAILNLGTGKGQGSRRIKIHLTGNIACAATVYATSTNPADQDEGVVHLAGGHASNSLQVMKGSVDLAMLPGYTGIWPTIVASGGVVRCGSGVTLTTVEAAGSSRIETRSAVTTARTRDNGTLKHLGSGNLGTLDIAGGAVEIQATGALVISQLNGYAGKTLDLTNCDSTVTVTNGTIYASPANPFTIKDPNNKLVMTNAFSTPNGAHSLKVTTGPGRNVRIT